MGAFSGSMTYKQYIVRDELPAQWRDMFQQGIQRHVFTPLDPGGEAERSVGWCSAHFPLDLDLDTNVYLYTDYIILGLRIDAWNIPSSLLKIYSESEARRVMAEQNREDSPDTSGPRSGTREVGTAKQDATVHQDGGNGLELAGWYRPILLQQPEANLDFMDRSRTPSSAIAPEGVYTAAHHNLAGPRS